MFASKEEIAKHSKYFTSAAQLIWLRGNEIPHAENDLGKPVVLLSVLEAYTSDSSKTLKNPIPISLENPHSLGTIFSLKQCGIYFLIRKNNVVYVGQTTNLFQRIISHQATAKKFDSFVFIPLKKPMLPVYEKEYIAQYKPEYNITSNPMQPSYKKSNSIPQSKNITI